jgi:hypothetical protein
MVVDGRKCNCDAFDDTTRMEVDDVDYLRLILYRREVALLAATLGLERKLCIAVPLSRKLYPGLGHF